jgi:hypothetical protein
MEAMALIEISMIFARNLHKYGWDFPWQTVSHNLDFPMDFLLQAEPRFGTSVPRATLTTTSATTPGRGWHHGRKTWWGFPMENSTLKHGVFVSETILGFDRLIDL